ncbi:MAG: VIT family protein [Candidatus Paralactobacillus gallistercoris]|uniref:VIT family protein n=1 Tax=Candidatus Paralactobacillus gallistercoris TaxID=2838724 RepID=A0A948TK99_9LACO|nr:VIT family protein [Candidatus Paralactobacillus gallistercoris]
MKKKKKKQSLNNKINLIRAIVMGANDGILSIAGIVIGVASAGSSAHAIFLAGIAGILAGTVSMAMGEYVSVSSERDMQREAIVNEQDALDNHYQREFNFIRDKYVKTGISQALATQATKEMLKSDQLFVAVRERYGFNMHEKTSAIAAAIASMISFPTGSLLPLAAITLLPAHARVIGTFVAVLIALAITGYAAAILSDADRLKATWRNILAGILTMLVTYIVGLIFGH